MVDALPSANAIHFRPRPARIDADARPGREPVLQPDLNLVANAFPALQVVLEAGVMIAAHGMHNATMPVGAPECRIESNSVAQVGDSITEIIALSTRCLRCLFLSDEFRRKKGAGTMATINIHKAKDGNLSYRVRIQRKGHAAQTATFLTLKEARK